MEVPVTNPSVPQFRALLPEFADSSVFADESIGPWLWIATQQLDPARWGVMFNIGVSWFVAHQLALQRQATLVARRGGVPGMALGVVSSKSVNGVSVSYDTNLGGIAGSGDWNLTTYGIRFLSFARMFGSGGVQITGIEGLPGAAISFPEFPIV